MLAVLLVPVLGLRPLAVQKSVGIAVRANNAIRPALFCQVVNRGLFVGEHFEEFEDVKFVVDGGWSVGHAVFLAVIYTGNALKS